MGSAADSVLLTSTDIVAKPAIRRSQVTLTALIDCMAGTVGGIACVLASQPLDTVKVKLQTYPEQYPQGMIECAVRTYKQGGVRGLYAGTLPNLVAQIAENATLFMVYGLSQKAIQKLTGTEGEVSFLAKASSGSVAAFFVSFVLTPTELVKCQLQAAREAQLAAQQQQVEKKRPLAVRLPTALEITRNVWRQGGFRGLFKGLDSTLAREVPGYFFFFAGYEGSKHFLINRYRIENQQKNENLSAHSSDAGSLGGTWFRTILCGAVAGVMFWSVMFPVDVVKSRIQTGRTQSSFLNCFGEIIKQEGTGALYNGFSSALLRTIPASAALFLAYEFTKQSMNRLIL